MLASLRADLAHEIRTGCPVLVLAAAIITTIDLVGAAWALGLLS